MLPKAIGHPVECVQFGQHGGIRGNINVSKGMRNIGRSMINGETSASFMLFISCAMT